MRRLEPNPKAVEKLFRGWSGRDAETVLNPAAEFPRLKLPRVMYPRGGLIRIFYTSNKFTPEDNDPEDRTEALYSHCLRVEPASSRSKRCVCGHVEHDELPSSLATVYVSEPLGEDEDTDWSETEPIEIRWPRLSAFCGFVSEWDEDWGRERVHEHRAKRDGWLVALDDKTLAMIRHDGQRVYLIYGGEMRVTPRGIVG